MEYDERLQQAYNAKTYGELDKLLEDLPKVAPAQASQLATTAPATTATNPVPQREAGSPHQLSKGWLVSIWGGWMSASLITTAIWAVTAFTSDDTVGFWPIWVILPFGAVCLATTIRRLAGDDSQHDRARDYRRQRRDRRRGRY